MNLSFFFLTLLLIPPPSSSSSFLSFSHHFRSTTSPSSSPSPPSSSPSSSLPPLSLLPFLCPNPAIQTDNLNCSLDNGDFSLKNITFPDHLNFSIIEYNIDRNGFGGDSPLEKGLQNIIDLFKASVLITPDFLILSEIARDCKSYGNYIDGAFEIAKSLNLYYVYGVEYILDEDTNDTINHQCTIGNAIMSKYKLDNPNFLRFERQCCKFYGRTGGRLAIMASLKVDSDHELVIYSTHLESGTGVKDLTQAIGARFTQTKEIIKHSNDLNGNYMSFEELEKIKERINRTEVLEQYKQGNAFRIKEYEELMKLTENLNKTIIIAGDLNTPLDKIDLAVDELLFNTFVDGHQKLSYFERNTCPFDELSKFGLFVYDYVFMKSARFQFSNPKVLNKDYNEKCYGASDHYPIMVNILENSKTFQVKIE